MYNIESNALLSFLTNDPYRRDGLTLKPPNTVKNGQKSHFKFKWLFNIYITL